jgi:FixJ family two-component response regulator
MTSFMSSNWRSRLGTMFAASAPSDRQPDEAPLPGQPEPEPVLIVDDDEAWASQCALSMRALGYEPIVARNAEDALALFRERPVTIALIDCCLPGGDGIALSGELSRQAEAMGRKLHVIMATGHATKDVAIDAIRASAADFLEKPIRLADLRKALQRINGLDDTPTAREELLRSMAGLRTELQRLSRLIDDPQPAGQTASAPASTLNSPAAAGSGRLAELSTPALADYIRELLKKETRRRQIGGMDVFGDPAWEMLLDLILAKIEGRRVPVSSACIASGAAMSTALRLVGRLVDEGVLCKQPDLTDRRRHFLIINPRFEVPLLEYLTDQANNAPQPGRR